MTITTKKRTQLKAYFVKNAIPTEGNFKDLIDAQLNQADDGVFKLADEPLSVVAPPIGGQKRVLRLYGEYPATNADWLISLNPAQNPADPSTNRPGFGIADGGGMTRFFISPAGNVGIGTNTPQATLDVVGVIRGQRVTVTGPIVPSVGNSENNGIQFPPDPGGGGSDRAFIRYFVESGERTKLLIGNNNDADDRISLYQMSGERLTVYNGCVGINNVTPGAALDISATTGTWGGWLEAIRFSRSEHSAITHPGGKLLFGLHSDRNFYFADTEAGRYVAAISTAGTGRLSVGSAPTGHALYVRSTQGDWQVRFENTSSNANVYMCHGGGHGMHVRTDTSSTTQYMLELYNANQGGSLFYVTTAGKVGIGTTGPREKLEVNGTTITAVLRLGDKWRMSAIGDAHGNDDWLRLFNVNNTDYHGGFAAGRLYTAQGSLAGSDLELKTGVGPLSNVLGKILALRGVEFRWKGDEGRPTPEIGLVAQELEQVFPELVEMGPDGYRGVKYGNFTAILLEAIKEQQQQIESLRRTLDTWQAQLS